MFARHGIRNALRTPKRSVAFLLLMTLLVTLLGTLLFTLLTCTNAGHLIGLTALPLPYFAFLAVSVFLYLLLVTMAKHWYIKKYHGLL